MKEADPWRIFLEQILTTLVSYADTAMVGAAFYRLIPLWMGAAPEILDTAAAYNLIAASSISSPWC